MASRLRRLVWIVLLSLLGLAAWLGFQARQPGPGTGREVTVRLERGAGVQRIAEVLSQHGLIRSKLAFMLLARLPGSGQGLRAGEYQLRDDMSLPAILRLLRSGRVVQHRFTVPEGSSLRQVAARLAAFNWLDEGRFLALCRDTSLLAGLGIEGDSAEGYLYPDTYLLIRDGDDEVSILRRMSSRSHEVWQQVSAAAAGGSLDRRQVLTLASMVEKETGHGPERPLVAGVFLNRLQRGMRLQSDPTVIYGLEDFDGRLTRNQLNTPSPYNTYTLPALPAGPICSPGRAALEAVLSPARTDALYFVSKNNGTHYFSRDLHEHNQAVRRYQRTEDRGQKTEKGDG
ncbi:MAG: hypothetical protein BWK76_20585 [Desulfobulbaceae bacterium A2]|nr:MAG: hypothetical protein BWK76_20585 [Desulfobulbaceae bacterium A2]